MREKSIDERLGTVFTFGKYDDGFVDLDREGIGCSCGIARHISPENAGSLISDREKLMQIIYDLANGWEKVDPLGFKEYWYK